MKQNEYTEYTYTLTNVNPYPTKGSTGFYIHDFAVIMKDKALSSQAIRLFLYICTDVNKYNQTTRSRREFADVLDIKYDAKRMSNLVKELIDAELIAIFDGNIITVSPFILMPSIKDTKMKSALQEAWRDIVEYNN